MEIDKLRNLLIINLIIGWIHLSTFSLFIAVAFGYIIHLIYKIIDENGQLQNLVLVLVGGFVSLTIFGSLTYASHEFIRGLKTRDHTRMLMFRICIIVLFLTFCGYTIYIGYNVYNSNLYFSEEYTIYRLIGSSIAVTFELIVWILVYIIYHKLRHEYKQKRAEKLHLRKLNTVAEQLTIFTPAYLPENSNDIEKDENEEGGENEDITEDADAEEIPFEKIQKSDKRVKKANVSVEFIENEKAVEERAFEKVQVEPKRIQQKTDNFPPPPEGF